MTGYADAAAAGGDAGDDPLLGKPFDGATLASAVRGALTQAAARTDTAAAARETRLPG
jgi:DNA-binding response OmpR family regulator